MENVTPLPRPSLNRLTNEQAVVFLEILNQLDEHGNIPKAKREEMVDRLESVCQTQEDIKHIVSELWLWIPWCRQRALQLTYLFQRATAKVTNGHKKQPDAHVKASALSQMRYYTLTLIMRCMKRK